MHDVARRLAFVSFLLLAACPSEEADPSESNDASSAPGDADAATATDGDGSEAFDTTPPEVDLEIEFTRVTPGSSQSPVGGFVLGDPGEIFASRASETVERSTDGGRSWETRAIGYMVVASDRRGRVYGFKRTPAPENEPSVSMDDGATFTKLSLPFVPTRQVLMFVTSDGALWVQENVESAPYRSADHGAHFIDRTDDPGLFLQQSQ